MVTITTIRDAAALIRGRVIRTPLVYSPTFSEMTGAEVYLKLEAMQKAGSFKVRGAVYRILSRPGEISAGGVITASAGNHAQGVAVAAALAGVSATIIMPEWVSLSKQEAAIAYGARVILSGLTLEESIAHARERARNEGMIFVHPYDDDAVIAGQGTLGLEILEDLPDADLIVVPVGGGGLIAGVATAVHAVRPATRIVGVQAAACPSAVRALAEGAPVTVDAASSIADGIRVKRVGDIAFPVLKEQVERVVLVDEDAILAAILLLLERKKVLAEGAGAAPLAALLSGRIPVKPGDKIVIIVSGGNIDPFLLERILRKGLADSGRIMRCTVAVEEGPRSLPGLLSLIASVGGVITRVDQERGLPGLPLHLVQVTLELETRGPSHRDRILEALKRNGYQQGLQK